MAQYSLENVTQKATKTMVSFYDGRTNTNIKESFLQNLKEISYYFAIFYINLYKKSLKTSKTIEPKTMKLGTRLSLRLYIDAP